VKTTQIDILEDGRIVLVLYKGGLPRGMSTHEAKLFAHDQFFGGLLDDLKASVKQTPNDCVRAVYSTRTFLEITN
jgi:hypothetical protein